MVSTIKNVLDDIGKALDKGDYDAALLLYQQIYRKDLSFFKPSSAPDARLRATHAKNAANLARRHGYLQWKYLESVSERLGKALKHFTGIERHPFQYPEQKPNFFYIPDLPSRPLFNASDIAGLSNWVAELEHYIPELCSISENAKDRYVDEFENLPANAEWDKLKNEWHSVHLVKGGEFTAQGQALSDPFKKLLGNELIADCPPHAPEAFISVLAPGAYIPPHHGISNCKLTVHIPLTVNEQASLTVADKTFTWSADDKVLIFDDSFLHSAKNGHVASRAVLIVDFWNPHLTKNERIAIKSFMQKFDDWNREYGEIARLDLNF